ALQKAIEQTRAQALPENRHNRFTVVQIIPPTLSSHLVRNGADLLTRFVKEKGLGQDIRSIEGTGFVGLDAISNESEEKILSTIWGFIQEKFKPAEFDPDAWQPIVIKDPQETREKLAAVAGEKYTYRDMDDFTDSIEKTLKTIPMVSKVSRSG